MSGISFLGQASSLTVFTLSALLLFLAARQKWAPEIESSGAQNDVPEEEAKDDVEERSDMGDVEKGCNLLRKYKWQVILAGTVTATFLFALWYLPPRLTGEIAKLPGVVGRPFFNLRWGYDFVDLQYNLLWGWSSIVSSIALLVLLAWSFAKRSRAGAEFALLASSLNLAILGQWLLQIEDLSNAGAIYYLIAVYGFLIWGRATHKRIAKKFGQRNYAKQKQILFLFLLLFLASFSRFYVLHSVPYGIEGDEAKWTAEAVDLGIRGVPDSSGEYHRDALPVSFFLQMPLHRLIGPSLYAARLTVAILSVLGTIIFYLYLRQLTDFHIAALSSALLAVSVFDISASRLANVESFVKLPPILMLALLAFAIRVRRWELYAVSGLALVFGLLTYDTVFPLGVIVLLLALIELRQQKIDLREEVKFVAALLAPTLLAMPLLLPYISSRLGYYEFDRKGFDTETLKTLWLHFKMVFHSWFVDLRPDFLFNREGPLLNAFLLPFLAFGFVLAILHFRQKVSYWNLTWALLVIFPIPILANSFMGRVYYPALPAVYVFVGLGLVFFWQELDDLLGRNFRPLLVAVTLVPLVWLPFTNLYLYFNKVTDPSDRQVRREIAEFAAQIAHDDSLLLLPTKLGIDTPLNAEHQMLELYMLQNLSSTDVEEYYAYLEPEQLLDTILVEKQTHENIEILFDPSLTPDVAETLSYCYPQGEITEGDYFTRVRLDANALDVHTCRSASLQIINLGENEIFWALEGLQTNEVNMRCETKVDDFIWIQAEQSPLSSGWRSEVDFAPGWTGTGFAMDNYAAGPLAFDLDKIDFTGDAYFWVRYYRRDDANLPIYLQVADESFPIADSVKNDNLHVWFWDKVGPVKIADATNFSIERTYASTTEGFMAFFVDAILITPNPNISPEKSLWYGEDYTEHPYSTPRSDGVLTLSLSPGHYRCQALVPTDMPIIEMGGGDVLYSNMIEFEIR